VNPWALAFVTLCSVLLVSCTKGEGDSGLDTGETPEAAESQDAGSSGMVSADAVKECAGFTPRDAAEILGVPAATLEDRSQDLYDTARSCAYASTADASVGVSFTLVTEESVEDAIGQMQSLRENAGLAKTTIEGVTGATSEESPLKEVEGIGDEAFWMEVNGTLTVRVGNVSILVIAPQDRGQQEEVARRVMEGLGAGQTP
jgi:hypothetical protein